MDVRIEERFIVRITGRGLKQNPLEGPRELPSHVKVYYPKCEHCSENTCEQEGCFNWVNDIKIDLNGRDYYQDYEGNNLFPCFWHTGNLCHPEDSIDKSCDYESPARIALWELIKFEDGTSKIVCYDTDSSDSDKRLEKEMASTEKRKAILTTFAQNIPEEAAKVKGSIRTFKQFDQALKSRKALSAELATKLVALSETKSNIGNRRILEESIVTAEKSLQSACTKALEKWNVLVSSKPKAKLVEETSDDEDSDISDFVPLGYEKKAFDSSDAARSKYISDCTSGERILVNKQKEALAKEKSQVIARKEQYAIVEVQKKELDMQNRADEETYAEVLFAPYQETRSFVEKSGEMIGYFKGTSVNHWGASDSIKDPKFYSHQTQCEKIHEKLKIQLKELESKITLTLQVRERKYNEWLGLQKNARDDERVLQSAARTAVLNTEEETMTIINAEGDEEEIDTADIAQPIHVGSNIPKSAKSYSDEYEGYNVGGKGFHREQSSFAKFGNKKKPRSVPLTNTGIVRPPKSTK